MKITLKTLAQATEQEVFDQVATHLLKQNVQAIDDSRDGCAYRGKDGTKCAMGCLMSDEEYDPVWDKTGARWYALARDNKVPREHCVLLIELQQVHDNHMPEVWFKKLRHLAEDYGLNMPV